MSYIEDESEWISDFKIANAANSLSTNLTWFGTESKILVTASTQPVHIQKLGVYNPPPPLFDATVHDIATVEAIVVGGNAMNRILYNVLTTRQRGITTETDIDLVGGQSVLMETVGPFSGSLCAVAAIRNDVH